MSKSKVFTKEYIATFPGPEKIKQINKPRIKMINSSSFTCTSFAWNWKGYLPIKGSTAKEVYIKLIFWNKRKGI